MGAGRLRSRPAGIPLVTSPARGTSAPSGTSNMSNGTPRNATNATLGFESKLWDAADLLRNNMDPAEYKHVVLGLLFLKYISDAFAERREWLAAEFADKKSAHYTPSPQDRDEVLEDRD